MKVAVDVGNSTIQIGFYKNESLSFRIEFVTDSNRSQDEMTARILEQLRLYKVDENEVDYLIYSSVVPTININLTSALKNIFKKASFFFLANRLKTGLAMKCDNPSEVGEDLIADLVSAKEKYQYPTIVVDLGTASKVLLIDKDGFFSGAVIMPGLIISAKSLFDRGEQLPNVSLSLPKKVIGRNTIDCMNSGIIYGHFDGVDGIIKRIENEIGYECKKVLTGGASIYVKDLAKDYIYDENLCLDGLYNILMRNI